MSEQEERISRLENRLDSLESSVRETETGLAVTSKALDVIREMVTQMRLDNQRKDEDNLRVNTCITKMQKDLEWMNSIIKWVMPSLLALIGLIGYLIRLVSIG